MNKVKPLTGRQGETLDFIKSFIAAKGYSPSIKEIGDGIGNRSPSTTKGLVDKLVEQGYITVEPEKSRSIRVVGAPPADEISELKRQIEELKKENELLHRQLKAVNT